MEIVKGLLAQRLEQRTHNPLVVGSNPTGPTKVKNYFMSECRVLFFGDIVGRPGRNFLKTQLPLLKDKYAPHFIFANGENATGGFGLNSAIAKELKDMGIQGITLGNHTWDQRSLWGEINAIDYVCRPLNFPEECPGKTYLVFEFENQKIALLNLLGRAFSNIPTDCPFKRTQSLIDELKQQGIENFIVDVHAEATAEKYTLAWFLAKLGGVVCMVGTHTHIQTADERIMNDTMAFICDLGMCGSYNSVLGFRADSIIEKSMHGVPCRFEVGGNPACLNGVFVKLDLEAHKAVSIERVCMIEQ